MQYKVDFCDYDSDYMRGRFDFLEAQSPQDAFEKAKSMALSNEDIRQIIERHKRPGKFGCRIVYDYMNGFLNYI